MKRQKILFCILVFALLFGGLILRRLTKDTAGSAPNAVPALPGDRSVPASSKRAGPEGSPSPRLPRGPDPGEAAVLPGRPGRGPSTDPYQDWKTSIDFFGQVIDQAGQPVEGATVEFNWNDLSPAGSSRARTLSDGQGEFALTGKQGKILSVLVTKPGYESPKRSRTSFEYADSQRPIFHVPDPSLPVRFPLWKKGRAEPLLHRQKLFGLSGDGTVYYLDLVEGKVRKSGNGDLAVRLERSEGNDLGTFDWSFWMEAPEGGLLESTNALMFLAPTNGYRKGIEVRQDADQPGWRAQEQFRFYLWGRAGGIYGRVEAVILPNHPGQPAIDLNYYLNTNGSRNLEYDPEAQPKPKVFE